MGQINQDDFVAGTVVDGTGNIRSTPTAEIAWGILLIPVEFAGKAVTHGWRHRGEQNFKGYARIERDEATAERLATIHRQRNLQ